MQLLCNQINEHQHNPLPLRKIQKFLFLRSHFFYLPNAIFNFSCSGACASCLHWPNDGEIFRSALCAEIKTHFQTLTSFIWPGQLKCESTKLQFCQLKLNLTKLSEMSLDAPSLRCNMPNAGYACWLAGCSLSSIVAIILWSTHTNTAESGRNIHFTQLTKTKNDPLCVGEKLWPKDFGRN